MAQINGKSVVFEIGDAVTWGDGEKWGVIRKIDRFDGCSIRVDGVPLSVSGCEVHVFMPDLRLAGQGAGLTR